MVSTTTKEVIQKNSRLKVYETLEIKRKYSTGYESSWLDISTYLRFTNATNVEQKLDFESFGYGQFKSGSGVFILDNIQGQFNSQDDLYSLFSGTISRHYTKIQYSAGYKDENGERIDEVSFQGLLNVKTIEDNFNEATVKFEALAYEHILSERSIPESSLTETLASDLIEEILTNDSTITDLINVSAGNINPENDITFDDPTAFEGTIVAETLNNIAQKTNSVWYVDSSQNLIFKSRDIGVGSAFAFIGGNRQDIDVNILAIEYYDSGFTKIINQVKYSSDSGDLFVKDSADNLSKYGTNELDLSGNDITTEATKQSIGENIVGDNNLPKRRLIIRTVYMPNVISFLDPCTVDYIADIILPSSLNLFVVNSGELNINNDYYIGKYANRQLFFDNVSYKYFGFTHNVKDGHTDHYLIED